LRKTIAVPACFLHASTKHFAASAPRPPIPSQSKEPVRTVFQQVAPDLDIGAIAKTQIGFSDKSDAFLRHEMNSMNA
jgi:hypothetical protein